MPVTIWREGIWQLIIRAVTDTDLIYLIAFVAMVADCGHDITAREIGFIQYMVITVGARSAGQRIYQCKWPT